MGVLAKPIPFGDYFLLEKVNTGGMAEVYKAKTFGVEGFERIVAVKKILPSIAEDKEFISMFIDEAKIAGQLQHANIAQIFDLGNIHDEYYIAMEYVSGHDLRVIYDRCARTGKKLDIACVCYIVSKICEGLDYAHNKKDANGEPMNIIHRDISPQNILIGYEGECKLIDFGIAKATNKSSATQVGILKGKFSYMSPEQIAGKNIDRRSDIFALGIVLFEMLTLKRLFLGASDFETLEKVRKVEVSPPTLYNSDIPEELEDIVLKALEKDVTQRYQSANELQEAIQRFMFKQNLYYTAKDLSEFMHTMFAQEIALEQKKKEFYKGLTRSVLAQSKKPEESLEDDTSFYERQNVSKMSGVTFDVVPNQPAPKQAIYAELDDFQPPEENIVYSQKSKNEAPTSPKKPENIIDIVSASVNTGRPHASSRRLAPDHRDESETAAPVINKNHETLLLKPVQKKRNSGKGILMAIVAVLILLIFVLIGFVFTRAHGSRNGMLTFKVFPEDVPFTLEINDDPPAENLSSRVDVKDLATSSDTRYRILADGYETAEGFVRADANGEVLNINLRPKQTDQEMLLRAYVSVDRATLTIDGRKVEGDKLFEIKPDFPGEHIIKVSKEGYKTEERKVVIDSTQQTSLSFDLKPAVAALVLKTDPYEARFKVTNLSTGESKTGKATPAGFRIPDLPVDDQYSIVIYDGNEVIETKWQPKELSLPNEDQTRVFPTHGENATAQAAAKPAETPKTSESAAKPKSSSTKSATSSKTSSGETKKASNDTEKKVESAPVAAPSSPTAATNAPGMLQIGSKPPAHVVINGKDYGSTPLKVELPAGTYKLQFINAERNINSTQTVTLKGGETQKVMRR